MNAVRQFFADWREAHQRMALIQRPWLEDFSHWCGDGDDAVLHGHVPPPRGRRSPALTPQGWCLGQSRSAGRVDEIRQHAR